MVLVLSANANASPHIPKEVERAVSRGISIIPLRVEDVLPAKSLDYFISSVHWLDAVTPPLESHLESLATTIRTVSKSLTRAGTRLTFSFDPTAYFLCPSVCSDSGSASGAKKPRYIILELYGYLQGPRALWTLEPRVSHDQQDCGE
jgi:hypothetical protein